MWRPGRMSRGQSTAEYAILIAVVIAAILAIQIYVKRAIEGRARQASDQIGQQFSATEGTYSYTTTTNSTRKDTVGASGLVTSDLTNDTTTRTGTETVDSAGIKGPLF